MTEPLGGWTDPREEWAFFVARLHADGPKGPACVDVVRRFVAGEIGLVADDGD